MTTGAFFNSNRVSSIGNNKLKILTRLLKDVYHDKGGLVSDRDIIFFSETLANVVQNLFALQDMNLAVLVGKDQLKGL